MLCTICGAPAGEQGESAGGNRAAAASLAIRECSLFDPLTGTMVGPRTIVITGERITGVGLPESPTEVPDGAQIVDGRGTFVLPGLIDAHVHLVHVLDSAHVTGDEILPMFLAAGVTTVRSTGEEPIAGTLVARWAQAHPERSPRVFTCSPLLDADPPFHRDIGRAVSSPEQVPEIVSELLRWNVTTLKIYVGTKRDVGRAIIEEGHRRGLVVTGHLGAYRAEDAVADGIDCIEHITSVMGIVPPPADGDAGRPLGRVAVDPTLVVFRNMILLPDDPAFRDHPDCASVPRRLLAYWPKYVNKNGLPSGPQADRRKQFAGYLSHALALYEAGVPLLVGTDAPEPYVPPGFAIHQEMELLVSAGIPPADVLKAATWYNARILNQGSQLGTIERGKYADLLVLEADPLSDILNTRAIRMVVRGGIVVRPNEVMSFVPRE